MERMGKIIVSKKIITLETILEPLQSTSADAEITLFHGMEYRKFVRQRV
jgi:hypothetical protein